VFYPDSRIFKKICDVGGTTSERASHWLIFLFGESSLFEEKISLNRCGYKSLTHNQQQFMLSVYDENSLSFESLTTMAQRINLLLRRNSNIQCSCLFVSLLIPIAEINALACTVA
jgi:hypothetical protein